MKILIAGFFHETMTFSKVPTTLQHFKDMQYYIGDELFKNKFGTRTPTGAYIDVLQKNKIEAVYSLYAEAETSGLVSLDAFNHITNKIIDDISSNPDISGVLLDLHGAMTVEGLFDPEGDFLNSIKSRFSLPIVAVLDFHANISQQMVDNSDCLVVYKTYPHVDMYDCGIEAANILLKIIIDKVQLSVSFKNLPLISPLLAQGSFKEPISSLMILAKSYYTRHDVMSISLAPGFGHADTPKSGFSVLVTTNKNSHLAAEICQKLCDEIWNKKNLLIGNPMPMIAAVENAKNSDKSKGPVILCDVSDNPGGGGQGDGTDILKELIQQNVKNALISTIWDPVSALILYHKSLGEFANINLGGKSPDHAGKSLKLIVKVISKCDGVFTHKGPMYHGSRSSLGRSVLVLYEGIKIIVHEFRMQTLDREMIRINGINPEDEEIIVVKSTIHYRADFTDISSKIIEVDAPGIVSPNLNQLNFKNIRRPIFPLDEMDCY